MPMRLSFFSLIGIFWNKKKMKMLVKKKITVWKLALIRKFSHASATKMWAGHLAL